MPVVIVETHIAAPIDLCFDLARDIDTHIRTSADTEERVVDGRTSGFLELGDTVTFEAVHLGVRQRLTSKITELDRPTRFVDEMVHGAFSSLRHLHDFASHNGITVMTDTLMWRSPLGIFGVIADKIFVTRHMRNYTGKKQRALKEVAENLYLNRRSGGQEVNGAHR